MPRRSIGASVVVLWLAVACSTSSSSSAVIYDGGGSSSSGSNGAACTMTAAGHPAGTEIRPRAIYSAGNDGLGPRECSTSDQIFDSQAAFDAYLASKTDGGAADAGSAVDWSKEVVFLHAALSNTTLDLVGVDGDDLVVVQGSLCQGVAPHCVETAYAVPIVKRITAAACPTPDAGPCLAP
jgi:hypothetical protein